MKQISKAKTQLNSQLTSSGSGLKSQFARVLFKSCSPVLLRKDRDLVIQEKEKLLKIKRFEPNTLVVVTLDVASHSSFGDLVIILMLAKFMTRLGLQIRIATSHYYLNDHRGPSTF